MAVFNYTARGKDGKVQKGILEESSKEAALNTLMTKGLLVTSIEESKSRVDAIISQKGKFTAYQRKRRLHSKITDQDMVMFSRQLGTMLEAGINLLKALNILITQIESKKLLRSIEQIKDDVEGGSTLKVAMEKHPKIFSRFWINLVETGEASGHVARSLDHIANFLESSGKVREKVISAMIYPCILICVATAAILIFVIKIVPIFAGILVSFDIELPTLTKYVIILSEVLTHYIVYIVGIVVIFIVGIARLIKTSAGKLFIDRLLLRIPLVGDLLEMMSCEQFASSLGTLLDSGVSILHALDIVGNTMGNKVYEEAIGSIKEAVQEGKTLAVPLEKSGVFPVMLVQMVTVGEEVGELGKMLQRVSDFYKSKVEVIVVRLTSMIEPFILVIMGGVVALLVLLPFLKNLGVRPFSRK